MEMTLIDQYHYCGEENKDKQYRNRERDNESKSKIIEFHNEIKNFYKQIYQIERENILYEELLWQVDYINDKGYVSYVNADRDIVDVYYLGNSLEEALETAIVETLFSISFRNEMANRKSNRIDFEARFPGEEYCGCIYFAEYQIKKLMEYYGGELPDKYKVYYEGYANMVAQDISPLEIDSNGKFKVKQLCL